MDWLGQSNFSSLPLYFRLITLVLPKGRFSLPFGGCKMDWLSSANFSNLPLPFGVVTLVLPNGVVFSCLVGVK